MSSVPHMGGVIVTSLNQIGDLAKGELRSWLEPYFQTRGSGNLIGPRGPAGPTGAAGPAGAGVPVGGTTGQALTKVSGADYDTHWSTVSGGGGSGASPTDTACWMPLTTTVAGVDVLVFDAGHNLIPTFTPI